VTVGVGNIDQLINLGFEQDSFNRLPSINFDKNSANTNFAKLNVVNPKSESICSLAVSTFKEAGIKLPTRAAETMLYGIRTATNNFTQVSDPATFEAAAYCKRSMIPGMVSEAATPKSETTENQEKNAPEAWLSPKIFRSNRVS
jgi:nanoRNase/pAp phosphatase (c-di-AMP/oligoRNAs hydrolase)